MDGILPTRAPRNTKQYFLGDKNLDEGTYNQLNVIKGMAEAGIPDKMLFGFLTDILFQDPKQKSLEDQTLRTKALEEASFLKQLGLEDQANSILSQYYGGVGTTADPSTAVRNAELESARTAQTTLSGDDLKSNVMLQNFLQGGGNIPSGQSAADLQYDPEKQSAYFDTTGYVSPIDRMNYAAQNFAGNPMSQIPLFGQLAQYMEAGDQISRKGRQYITR